MTEEFKNIKINIYTKINEILPELIKMALYKKENTETTNITKASLEEKKSIRKALVAEIDKEIADLSSSLVKNCDHQNVSVLHKHEYREDEWARTDWSWDKYSVKCHTCGKFLDITSKIDSEVIDEVRGDLNITKEQLNNTINGIYAYQNNLLKEYREKMKEEEEREQLRRLKEKYENNQGGVT